jgi:formyl-CoA transferase
MTNSTTENSGALAGVRVLDLSRILAGPYCTQILGDLGADVIKVEQPGTGDGSRAWSPPSAGGEAAYYLSVNRNKRSLTANLKSEAGRRLIRELAANSDVLVENFKYGELARLGLDYAELSRLNPHLIYCTISGYGATGPYKERPGFDFMMQAQTGVMSFNGTADSGPLKVGVAVVDITTGLFAGNAILAALFARERDPQRRGQKLDISLYECALAWLANIGSNYLVSGENPQRWGNAHPNVVPYQPFDTADVPLAVAIGTDGQFRKFCMLVNKPEWASDARFVTNAARVRHRDELIPLMSEIFIQKSADEWEAALTELDIPAGSINTFDRVFSHPQTLALQIVHEIQHPTAGSVRLVRSPLNMSRTPTNIRYAPPLLGQHTAEVLQELGYSPAQVEDLRRIEAI